VPRRGDQSASQWVAMTGRSDTREGGPTPKGVSGQGRDERPTNECGAALSEAARLGIHEGEPAWWSRAGGGLGRETDA
jgi:hypothetical protein